MEQRVAWILGITDNASSRMGAIANATTGLGAAIAIAAVALAGIGVKAASASLTFDTAMNSVAAVSGATGVQFELLEQQALDMGSSTAFSATQAAEAQGFLAMAGLNTNQVYAAMPATLTLAAAGALEIGEAADIATNVMSGMGLAVADLPHIADVLASAAASSNTSVSELGLAMSYAAPAAASVGQSVEMAAAAIGVLSNSAMGGSKAGTRLNVILNKMAEAGADGNDTLDRLGVTVTDVHGAMLPLDQITSQLRDSNLTLVDAQKLVGIEAAGALLVMANESEQLTTLTEKFIAADGAAQDMRDTQQQGLVGSFTNLTSATEGMWIALGQKLEPVTREFVRIALDLVTALTDWINESDTLDTAIIDSAKAISGFYDYCVDAVAVLVALKDAFMWLWDPVGSFTDLLAADATEIANVTGKTDTLTISVADMTAAHETAMDAIGLLTDDEILLASSADEAATAERNQATAARELADVFNNQIVPATQLSADMVERLDWRYSGLAGTIDAITPRTKLNADMVKELGNQFVVLEGTIDSLEPAIQLTGLQAAKLGGTFLDAADDGAKSAAQWELAVAGISSEFGTAAGQALAMFKAVDEEGNRVFSDMELGVGVFGAALATVGSEVGGTIGEMLNDAGGIAMAFATGGPLMAGIQAAMVGVKWLAKGIKALFSFGGPSDEEMDARGIFDDFRVAAVESLSEVDSYNQMVADHVADGWDLKLAQAVSAFSHFGQQAGLTHDEAVGYYTRFQDAVGRGDTATMDSILGIVEGWKETGTAAADAAGIATDAQLAAAEAARLAQITAVEEVRDARIAAAGMIRDATIAAAAEARDASIAAAEIVRDASVAAADVQIAKAREVYAAWSKGIDDMVSVYRKLVDEANTAYDEALAAAVEAGAGQVEAVAIAEAARESSFIAGRQMRIQEMAEEQAFQAALLAIKEGNWEGAKQAAIDAYTSTIAAANFALDAVIFASNQTAEALGQDTDDITLAAQDAEAVKQSGHFDTMNGQIADSDAAKVAAIANFNETVTTAEATYARVATAAEIAYKKTVLAANTAADEAIAALNKTTTAAGVATSAVNGITAALAAIPRAITTVHTTVQRTIYEGGSASPSGASSGGSANSGDTASVAAAPPIRVYLDGEQLTDNNIRHHADEYDYLVA